ncbi:CBD9-like protein [Glarea lozoyensis ATCC 20868]|uniref:CBD9-like protein n=1 Tax=Glarea lozoyensis (strain ATCC 20868 / MF5171) TaxID=1116229 RepID=S3CQ40_GLAL2|nr:CBD9-like protein [Glarea lozoyensis ATCC 20868]EPE27800.1 CBD9-like protein [Glarea lozoyensis ATCC 20868]
MLHLRSVLVAAAALFVSNTVAVSSAAFVSDLESIKFTINIPQEENSNELYFSMSGPSSCSWLAVGLGSSNMKNSLMFMAYKDKTGQNVTLSPRLSYNNVEPVYTSEVKVTYLPGTGVFDNITTVNAKCSNCRQWKEGSIDPKQTEANFIWANAGVGNLKSNSLTANLKRHGSYGKFKMDLTKAVGAGEAVTPANVSSAGSAQLSEEADHDFSSGAHALIMIFTFVGLIPLAVMILRILNSPKWHGIVQTISATLALIGMGLGFKIGTMYNRTKKFNSAHQVIGLIVILAMIGQFILGFLHHRMYSQTKLPTKLGPIHVWLGRFVVLLGIVSGFVGFPLAQNSIFNWPLLGLVLFGIIFSGPFIFWRWRRNMQKANKAEAAKAPSGGYQAEPWRGDHSQNDVDLQQMNHQAPPPMYSNQYR